MKKSVLLFLGCPRCRGDLRLEARRTVGDEVQEGILCCDACRREYAVTDGIPRFLPTEMEDNTRKNRDAFGYEWVRFKKILGDYERQLYEWVAPVGSQYFKGKVVLDAGCGMGRHMLIMNRWGVREIVGVDASESVCVAYEHSKHLPNVHVVQGDLKKPPFKKNVFDVAYSIGVVHHIEDAEYTVKEILSCVRCSGSFLIWVYGEENNTLLPLLKAVRYLTTRVPYLLVELISYLTMIPLHPIFRVYSVVNPPLRRLNPMHDFIRYLGKNSFKNNASILFDQLIAPYSKYYTRRELMELLGKCNLKSIRIQARNNNSWIGFGEKEDS